MSDPVPEGRLETEHWPTEIRLKTAEQRLEIDFDNGKTFSLPAELLRVESPSAEVQGHSAAQKKLVAGKRNVAIQSVDPVGHYAIRLRFDDGHATGIYSWRYLYELGDRQDELWERYLNQLAEKGLSRDR
ncbi:MAG: DUF971 domain-containing protein [Alphaproteobacteria bacterium]|jgi:DUF971 family protein|nr:DUF971 domain-containing protein [Alphaproteobacteria bacterium]